MTYKEKREARIIFKQLKTGLRETKDLSDNEIKLLKKYYPFIFR